jgi:hypothetical protein
MTKIRYAKVDSSIMPGPTIVIGTYAAERPRLVFTRRVMKSWRQAFIKNQIRVQTVQPSSHPNPCLEACF